MNLEEYLNAIEASDRTEWTNIDRPTFAQDLHQITGGSSKTPWVEIHEHHTLLSLRSNLAISIALGLSENDDFQEPWANKFADRQASSHWVDFRYCGTVVLRELSVSVDGGRASLPVPVGPTSLQVPKRQYYVWRLIDEIRRGSSSDFDAYFQRAGFELSEIYWPGPG